MNDQDPGQITILADTHQIILKLDSIRDLFIAPDLDPFSSKETHFMGQSAFSRVVRQLRPGWTLHARDLRMTILLPEDQITPGLEEQVRVAVHRACRVKTDDNLTLLRTIRWNGIRQLPFSFAFLAVCVGLGTFFGSGIIPGIPVWLGTVLNEGFYIIGWVSLWGPTQTLLFDPLPVKRENRVLQALMDIPVEIIPG